MKTFEELDQERSRLDDRQLELTEFLERWRPSEKFNFRMASWYTSIGTITPADLARPEQMTCLELLDDLNCCYDFYSPVYRNRDPQKSQLLARTIINYYRGVIQPERMIAEMRKTLEKVRGSLPEFIFTPSPMVSDQIHVKRYHPAFPEVRDKKHQYVPEGMRIA